MTRNRNILRIIFAALLGTVAALAIEAERSRRRRAVIATGAVAGASTTPFETGAQRPTAPVAPARVMTPRPEPSLMDDVDRYDARQHQPATRTGGRHLPRIALAAALIAAGIPLALVLFGTSGHGAPTPTLAAEAVDTPDGVVVMARGEHFAANADVSLYWHHQDGSEVHATASASGALVAAVPLPSDEDAAKSPDGSLALIADDGSHQALAQIAPASAVASVQSTSSVLGATATSRVMVGGSPYFLLGADYPWANYGNDFGSNAWGSYGVHSGGNYAADFAAMKAKGVHVVRWWVFADGRAGINFAADGTPLGVQPVVYSDLDQAVSLARQNGIYLDLVLFDVSMLSNPSFYGGVQMGGHSDAFIDPTKRSALVNNVVAPLAKHFANEPAVLSFELMNEPEWGIIDLPQPAVNSNYNPVTMAQFWSFASSASQMIHLYSSSQVTVGSAALKWNQVWTDKFSRAHALPPLHLDFYQTHYYQWMDCCSTSNDPDLGTTTWSPLTQAVAALGLDKPIVVGEIHTPGGSAGSELDQILANGYAGFWGWSYNYQNTGDKLQIDWSTYTPWEAAHASIVRIPPPGGAQATPTAAAPTATNTANVAPTATPVKSTATATPKAATATATPKRRGNATSTPTQKPATATPRPATATPQPATATPRPPTATPQPPTATPIPPKATPTQPAPVGTPVAIAFGRTSSYGYNDNSDWGYLNGTLAALPSTGTLSSLSVYVGSTSGSAHLRLALYADNGGQPSTLLAQTGQATASLGWNTISTTTNPSITSGNYWIVAQTDDQATVYRMADGMNWTSAVGWSAQPYGPFPASAGGWVGQAAMAFSMYGTVMSAATSSQATPVPTVQVPTGETVVPMSTSTPTPQAPTAMPQPPTATPQPATATATAGSGGGSTNFEQTTCMTTLDPSGQSQCGNEVGDKFNFHFCNIGGWAYCNDFSSYQTSSHVPFPQAADKISFNFMSTTGPQYYPSTSSSDTPCCKDGPEMYGVFAANEHFMEMESDSNFGGAIMRLKQPFDITGRTGHIHFDVDLKTSARRYVRVTLSPQITKRGSDDRSNGSIYPDNALDLWFKGGQIFGTLYQNHQCGGGYCFGNLFQASSKTGFDNVRNHIDVYVSRTHVKVQIDGVTYVDQDVPDIGFSQAYVYLQQASYNPCKDGTSAGDTQTEIWPGTPLDQCTQLAQEFHWDNIAFDGPVLPVNGLTPAGSEDVAFNAYSVTEGVPWNGGSDGAPGDCTVKGVAAQPIGPSQWGTWSTWVARLPAGTSVSAADVQCVYTASTSSGVSPIQDLEIVQPGG